MAPAHAPTFDPNRFQAEIDAAKQVTGNRDTARRALQALDFTTLQDKDGRQGTETQAEMATFLEAAKQPVDGAQVAAVCVYTNKIREARKALAGTGIGIATVVNFPMADSAPESVKRETRTALKAGATEIDVVVPFKDAEPVAAYVQRESIVKAVRSAAPDALIKVILETNQLKDADKVYLAATAAIAGGADMLKTSTGKNDGDVTLEHAAAMMAAIKDSGKDVGLKISKGVKTNDQAAQYMALADSIMGEGFSADPSKFRFGASGLRDSLVAELAPKGPAATGDAPTRRPSTPGGSDY